MVAIDTIRASNTAIKGKLPTGLVALFVGATSGIGEATLRTFFQSAPSPRVYFVGRSQSSADRIIESLKPLNPDGHVEFIQADVSLMKNVDDVTKKLEEKEKELHLLVMTQGFLTPSGRDETTEGFDTKLALNWFSRARFIQNLLPQLNAGSSSPFGARVLSVLSTGREGPINWDDYGLVNTFSLRNAEVHAVSSNSAAMLHLATKYPNLSFVHSYPGGVDTPILDASQFPAIAKTAVRVLKPLLRPFITSSEESGQRHFWMTTDEKFKTGAWLMDSVCGESAAAKKNIEKGYCDEKTGERVWNTVTEMFAKVEKGEKPYP